LSTSENENGGKPLANSLCWLPAYTLRISVLALFFGNGFGHPFPVGRLSEA